MHQALLAERLGAHDESGAAIWPQAGDGTDDPARIDFDWAKRGTVGECPGPRTGAGATGQQSGGAGSE
jgi:hypothetical protein